MINNYLLCPNPRYAFYYIGSAMKEGFTGIGDVMPFIQFFVRNCNETYFFEVKKYMKELDYPTNGFPRISLQEQKKKMMTFQNSLKIMNHFKTLH